MHISDGHTQCFVYVCYLDVDTVYNCSYIDCTGTHLPQSPLTSLLPLLILHPDFNRSCVLEWCLSLIKASKSYLAARSAYCEILWWEIHILECKLYFNPCRPITDGLIDENICLLCSQMTILSTYSEIKSTHSSLLSYCLLTLLMLKRPCSMPQHHRLQAPHALTYIYTGTTPPILALIDFAPFQSPCT